MLLPLSCFFQVHFAARTGNISAWAMTCLLPARAQAVTKGCGTWSPKTHLKLRAGSTSKAPCVTVAPSFSTAPSEKISTGGIPSQGLIVLGPAELRASNASDTAYTSSGVTFMEGPAPPSRCRSWHASCVQRPNVWPAAYNKRPLMDSNCVLDIEVCSDFLSSATCSIPAVPTLILCCKLRSRQWERIWS